MRDPNRLDNFYTTLCKIHKESFPDLRFGQLMSNFSDWLAAKQQIDIYFPEENKLIEYLNNYVEYIKDR